VANPISGSQYWVFKTHDFICSRWVQAVTYPENTLECLKKQKLRTDRICHDTVSNAQVAWRLAGFCAILFTGRKQSPSFDRGGRVVLLHRSVRIPPVKVRHASGCVSSALLNYKLLVSLRSKIQDDWNECGQHNSAAQKECWTGQVRILCNEQKRAWSQARQVTPFGSEYSGGICTQPQSEDTTGKCRPWWEDNIKVHRTDSGCSCMQCVHGSHNRFQVNLCSTSHDSIWR
jgi:hypothetical protein